MLACALAALMLIPQAAQARVADSDHDGLGNRLEKRHSHTNPRRADTDRDGLRDKYELRRSHTNPRKKDTDRDGLSDGFEVNRLEELAAAQGHRRRRALGPLRGQAIEDLAA